MPKIPDLKRASRTERKMIEELLTMKEREINKMVIPINEVTAFPYDRTLSDVIEENQRNHYSRYPVYFDNIDQIIGILHMKDIIAFWNEYRAYPIVEFVRLPYFVYEDRSSLDVFLELQRLRISLAVVIDEFGGVTGIITIEDLLEEIVGDIEDEFDARKKPFIEKLSDNEYILNTRMELDDFADYFHLTLHCDDVSTIGGFILKSADRIPKVGEEIIYKNLVFKVLEGTRRRINKVHVTKKS